MNTLILKFIIGIILMTLVSIYNFWDWRREARKIAKLVKDHEIEIAKINEEAIRKQAIEAQQERPLTYEEASEIVDILVSEIETINPMQKKNT